MIFYIFSYDRPLQLHGLLKSMEAFIMGNYEIMIQYKFSNKEFENAYNDLFAEFPKIDVVSENIFYDTLTDNLNKLPKKSKISFLVDDILFIRNIDLSHVTNFVGIGKVFSLRLGLTLSESKIIKKYQEIPTLKKINKDIYLWSWGNSSMDWGYLYSLDGNVFLLSDIIEKIKSIKFKGPNSLEARLNKKFTNKHFMGGCFSSSAIVNLPLNRVQTEVNNWSKDLSTKDLLKLFQSGSRVDLSKYINHIITSVHEDWKLYVKK